MFKSVPVLALALGLGMVAGWGQEPGQPIVYNHHKHVTEAGMGCLDCHSNAEAQARASIPNIRTCGDCHADAEAENSELRKVAEYAANGTPIPWKQIHTVPDYVYFSHRRHVSLGQMDCSACHGDVGAMTVPFSKPFVPMKMAWCMECHAKREVSNDCSACHR